MNYDYIIYGAGPTGLTLSFLLAKNNKKILLVEKDTHIGGCWKHTMINNKYFSEHSPRVLSTNYKLFIQLLKNINYDFHKNTVNIYGNYLQTSYKILSFFISQLSFSDIFTLIINFPFHSNLTVYEWFNKYNISNKGKKALTIFSIAIANSPKKLLMNELYSVINNSSGNFVHFTNYNWIQLLYNKLIQLDVHIITNANLQTLVHNNNTITHSVINNKIYTAHKHILTLPPIAFLQLLQTQNTVIQNNWMDFSRFYKLILNSYYISFSFQLHFSQIIPFTNKWCWSCFNDYHIIILPVSQFLHTFTKDNNIKTVWSCTIVDTDYKVSKHNKTINQLSKNTIINDVLQLLNVKPDKITFYPGLQNINNKWISKDSAFSLGKYGVIKSKGKIDNLYTVGPHNIKGITTLEKAIYTATLFVQNENLSFNLYQNNYYKYIIIPIIIFILYKIFY